MEIIFFGNGGRGLSCLKALIEKGYAINLIVVHPGEDNVVAQFGGEKGIPVIAPQDPNAKDVLTKLHSLKPDLFVLAAYGKIFQKEILSTPKIMCLNLHGGKLPESRGSSPMNWALINGKKTFTLSIIKLDEGVDSGDVLIDKTFDITINDTINDLHKIAHEQYPLMLLEVIEQIEKGTVTLRKQDETNAGYYPLRFPDDGLILWDMYTAEQVHNHIRALTAPYPCAFTFYQGRKMKIISSRLTDHPYCGEPGRIYKKTAQGILVCALDQCLWISEAVFEDTAQSIMETVQRYDKLATLRWASVPEAGNDK